jgi:methylmalonyl-CoA/ethylmalonyl-CoA epimerase
MGAEATTDPAGTGIEGILQVHVPVRDLARATAFYRDMLGLRFLFEAAGMAFFDCGGVRLMLSRSQQPEHDHPASILYYRVPSARRAHAALAALGVAFEAGPHVVHRAADHEVWMAFLRDPEDNLLALASEERPA